MKQIWIIPLLLLLLAAPPAWGAFPKMESASFVITSSEFSSMGKYKEGDVFNTWDTAGQPTPIGAWPGQGNHSGAGWAYTINLPVWWDKDRDRDGMPTAWEEQFARWTDPEFNVHTMWDYNPMDAIEDWDGDGFVNIQEFLARTSPIDGTSFFQFTDIRVATSAGEPLLIWRNPTIRIDGFETEYPDYTRSLSYDILYADWPAQSQLVGEFPSGNWFNLTGTWQVHESGTGLRRHGEFNYFTDTTLLGDLDDGDIRFYRLAIGGTWLEGEPTLEAAGTWRYYTEMGTYRLASTLAREVMMVQRRNIPAGYTRIWMGLAGNVPGSGGVLDHSLGTAFFPAGEQAAKATKLNLWKAQERKVTVDWLDQNYARWVDQSGIITTRTISGSDGFRLVSPDDPFPALSFFAGASLKMDSYYNVVHKRAPGPLVNAFSSELGNYMRLSYINYNFPVSLSFTSVMEDFPDLAGASVPTATGWQAFESDWVVFFNQDLSTIGGSSNELAVAIYQDHTAAGAGQWKYAIPLTLWMQNRVVGPELKFHPGSPVGIMQYWDPNQITETTIEFDVPYQDSGSNEIKTYLRFVE